MIDGVEVPAELQYSLNRFSGYYCKCHIEETPVSFALKMKVPSAKARTGRFVISVDVGWSDPHERITVYSEVVRISPQAFTKQNVNAPPAEKQDQEAGGRTKGM